jgi:hypothetical protein
MKHKTGTILFLLLLCRFGLQAQNWQTEKKINVLFGLSQPLVAHGFNIEFNYIHNRLIFDFSQGIGLQFSGNTLPVSLRDQNIEVHMPWTTGFGIGYQFTNWINVRVEPKWHRFEFNYQNQQEYSSNEITSYNTFTLGLGVYGSYLPFKKKSNYLKGIMISPSVRYWPTVHSTLPGNDLSYYNETTGSEQNIKTYGPGIQLSSWVVNISIGYSFQMNKKSR